MMILDIDAGNSRLKFRLMDSALVMESQEITYGQSETALFESLEDRIKGYQIERVRVASVRDASFNSAFAESVKAAWQIEPEFARVEQTSSCVSNSYKDIQTMGVDRWLAMLAAYNNARSACCVLDCGSAITFDWIDYEGQHQGGFIVPGINLMQESLASKTAALATKLEHWENTVPGISTDTAISQGILAMVTGFARHCREHVEQTASQCHWFLTGGDAERIGRQLDWDHEIKKDLVLDGLGLSLP